MIPGVALRLVEQVDPSHVGPTQALLQAAIAEPQPQTMQNAVLKNGLTQVHVMQSILPLRPLAIPGRGTRSVPRMLSATATVLFAQLLPKISRLERSDVDLKPRSASIFAALRGRLAQA